MPQVCWLGPEQSEGNRPRPKEPASQECRTPSPKKSYPAPFKTFMIPYFFATTVHLGPVPIQVWGFFVALGIMVGARVAARQAEKKGFLPGAVWDIAGWMLPAAFVGARLFHVFVYLPNYYLLRPAEWLAVWDGGFSFIGGLAAAILTGIWFLKKKKFDAWAYADLLAYGTAIGYAIGRIGCFLIHDHPGIQTSFFLGVRYPDGVVRHDLGFYEILNGLGLAILLFVLQKKEQRPGISVAVALAWYGVVRFFLDFLRIGDARYFSITPAQWISLAMAVAGIALLVRLRKSSE